MQNDLNLNSVTIDHVAKNYDGTQLVLKDISLSVKMGEFVCIVGASGCGKSTLLKIIAGIDMPSSGTVKKPENISMVFQSGALLPWLTVKQNIAFGFISKKNKLHAHASDVARYVALLGLEGLENKYPRELSGGQRQRVGIARALIVNPDLILLDEPFSALDIKTTHDLHKDIEKIWAETGKTMIMISHSVEEAVSLADRVCLMRDGKIEHIFEVPLPRPRREHQESFIDIVEHIRTVFFRNTQ